MVQCCFPNCHNSTDKKRRYEGTNVFIGFHKFPSRDHSPKRYRAWTKKVARKDWTPKRATVVCSQHFPLSDFLHNLQHSLMPDIKSRMCLKKTAVPSLHIRAPAIEPTPGKTPQTATKRVSVYLRKKLIEEIIAEYADIKTIRSRNRLKPVSKLNAGAKGCAVAGQVRDDDCLGTDSDNGDSASKVFGQTDAPSASTRSRSEGECLDSGVGCQCELGQETLENATKDESVAADDSCTSYAQRY